jgi:hypothetical protein
VSRGASVCRPRIPVADVDGEEFEEAQRGPTPGPGGERRKRRPGSVVVDWDERSLRSSFVNLAPMSNPRDTHKLCCVVDNILKTR